MKIKKINIPTQKERENKRESEWGRYKCEHITDRGNKCNFWKAGRRVSRSNIDPWELLNAVTSVRCVLKSKLKWTGDILL